MSPARQELERVNARVRLVTRTPGESITGKWEAEWWDIHLRPVRTYDGEDELIADLRSLFGPTGRRRQPRRADSSTMPEPAARG